MKILPNGIKMRVLIEKLKACYYILTSHTYYVFCLTKEPKTRKVYIENPTKFIDEVVVEYLQSDEYKEFREEYGYDQ